MKEMMVYLKTTETCNLDCKHCFTSGSRGAKIFFNPIATVDWLQRLSQYTQDAPHMHIEFHGGEPFLAPVASMQFLYDNCNQMWKSQSWGMTSNLVFKLTDNKIKFIHETLNGRIGTSWDPAIRFTNDKQRQLWTKNIHCLNSQNVELKVNVSITKDTIRLEPIHILTMMAELGFKEIAFERLTHNGTALQNPEIFPTNVELDRWLLLMHHQTVEYNARDWIVNEFLESVYDKFESGLNNSATFCRDCEQKLFTVNADGTIAGCPNSAPEDHYGHISDDIDVLFNAPKRMHTIACEVIRDPRCYTCPVFEYCNSDCHQIGWQGSVCGAPKSLMLELASK